MLFGADASLLHEFNGAGNVPFGQVSCIDQALLVKKLGAWGEYRRRSSEASKWSGA